MRRPYLYSKDGSLDKIVTLAYIKELEDKNIEYMSRCLLAEMLFDKTKKAYDDACKELFEIKLKKDIEDHKFELSDLKDLDKTGTFIIWQDGTITSQ